MNDGVAVVVPAHDAARFLRSALESLQQQTLPPAEVVVVDDGSTDGTAAVAEELGVRCLRQEQRGPGAARNRAIAATSAPWVAFLDADDWFAPTKLERQLAAVRARGAAAMATEAWVVVDDQVAGCKNRHRRVPEALTLERLLQDNPVVCSTVVARREALQQAGGFDEDPDLVATEDYDLWLRLARQQPIAYLPEPLSYYRVHRGSLSANARFLRGVDRIMDKLGRSCGGDPRFGRLRARRRARARLDVAWDLLVAGQGAECRRLLREAVGLAGWSLPALRMWARSLLPFPAR